MTVNDALSRRRATREGARRAVSVFLALVLHGGLAATAALAPFWMAEEQLPIEYVPVQLVPPPALGRPAPPEPEPEPEPTPPPPAPEPEPRDEPPAVTLPDPDAEKAPPEEPRPAPPAQPERPKVGSPTGHPDSPLTSGSAVTLDNPDFTYGYYVDRLVAVIREQWKRPALGGTVEAVVSFRIHSNGRVTEVRIAQSSGYSGYDLAAMRAVSSAAPLPPLPPSFKEPSLGVHLIFR